MKILILSPMMPYPPIRGGKIRIFNFIKQLSKRHEVSLLALTDSQNGLHDRSVMGNYCRHVEVVYLPTERRPLLSHLSYLFSPVPYYRMAVYSDEFLERLRWILKKDRCDIVQIECLKLAHYARFIPDTKTILDMHDVESELFSGLYKHQKFGLEKLLTFTDAIKMKGYQRKMLSLMDGCLAVSEHDKAILCSLAPDLRISVISNGVDTSSFYPKEIDGNHLNLLYVGTYTYWPNVDAVLHFYHRIFPLIQNSIPEVKFYIIGSSPPTEIKRLAEHGKVFVTGCVEDIRSYLSMASVVVVPLRVGSGSRIKILEAMAMGRPVVSTSKGAEGLDLNPGEDIIIADEPHEFAEQVIQLLRDKDLRQGMGWKARKWVKERYDWTTITEKLSLTYKEILN